MYKIKNRILIVMMLILAITVSCHDLDELNIDPNGIQPEFVDPNLLLPTILTGLGQNVVGLGFGNMAGVMQHTQEDGWQGYHNGYDWNTTNQSWSSYYGILLNNNEYYKKAVEGEYRFHEGVALVIKSYTFGMITDLWGDAPYSDALKGEESTDGYTPKFDSQQDIYIGILTDLEKANTLLSGTQSSYENIDGVQDVMYNGDVSKWRKFANSLALRYYMRLQVKLPTVSEDGIRKITNNQEKYPLIVDASDDATIGYIGTSPSDSWKTNTVFGKDDPSGAYYRLKMCSTLVEVLQGYKDPRLAVWANNNEIPLVVVGGSEVDEIVDGKRYISQDVVDDYESSFGLEIDLDDEFVGIPPAVAAGSFYNLNPNKPQGEYNPHASQLHDRYKETNDPLALMRLISAAEVHFILAEAAIDGWAAGTPDGHYGMGVAQSLNAWGVGDQTADYLIQAPYTDLASIIEQKWIASWTAAAESWFDYRRTGLPALQIGEAAKRDAMPLRFYYHFQDEVSLNEENANAAIDKLIPTGFNGGDGKNSAWSKMWLLQGTNLPY